ncbi:MAG TPA: DUF4276 family protein [Gemmataceae bacterium]|jgi:hypothetical protein
MTLYVVPIVEGHTEAGCVERLLQRIWAELLVSPIRLQVLMPSRGKRDALIDPTKTHLADKIEEAFAKLNQRLRRDPSGRGLLLLLIDAESDCPAKLAPRLFKTARSARSDADIACVLAKRMLENWIVAGASTLAGVNGLAAPLTLPDYPEKCNGAAWLEQQLRNQKQTRRYKKTADAEVFVRGMSLDPCRAHSPSFDKLCRELAQRLPPPETSPDPAPPSPPSK